MKIGSTQWYVNCTNKINENRIIIRSEIARIELKKLAKALNIVGPIASKCGMALRDSFLLLVKLQQTKHEK